MHEQMLPPIQTAVVMALGKRARRLSWGYFAYVAYYVVVMALFAYHGVRWASTGQIADDVLRLSGVWIHLLGYVIANAGIGSGLRYYVGMNGAVRWCVAAAAALLAAIVVGLYVWSVYRHATFRFDGNQVFGLVLAAGQLFLACRVVRLTRALNRFVLVDEGVWLPKPMPH